jgi:hypothetical protein
MGQRLQPRQTGDGASRWLSLLVDTMEQVSREKQVSGVKMGCRDPQVTRAGMVPAALSAQLARPATRYQRKYVRAHPDPVCGTIDRR